MPSTNLAVDPELSLRKKKRGGGQKTLNREVFYGLGCISIMQH